MYCDAAILCALIIKHSNAGIWFMYSDADNWHMQIIIYSNADIWYMLIIKYSNANI